MMSRLGFQELLLKQRGRQILDHAGVGKNGD